MRHEEPPPAASIFGAFAGCAFVWIVAFAALLAWLS
jgi:hypothetical protein